MKSLIAYALVFIGVTQLIGMQAVSAISIPITMLVPQSLKIHLIPPLLDLFNGAASLAAGLVLFWLLGLSVTALLPIIVGAWLVFYFISYGQSKSASFAAIAGVLICWIVYRVAIAP